MCIKELMGAVICLTKYSGEEKNMVTTRFRTKVLGAVLMAGFCMLVTGCGSSNDGSALLLAAANQNRVPSTQKINDSIIGSSSGIAGGSGMSSTDVPWRNVAGKAVLSLGFARFSSSDGKGTETRIIQYKYSVDAQGRLTKQTGATGFSNISTSYAYDGTTTVVKNVHGDNLISDTVADSTYTYDTAGRITGYKYISGSTITNTAIAYSDTGRTETTTDSATPSVTTTTATYDKYNNPLSLKTGTTEPTYTYVYTLDASGHPTETRIYTQTGTAAKVLDSASVNTYGPNGENLTIKTTKYASDGTTVYNTQESTYVYGANGKESQWTYVVKDGQGVQISKLVRNTTYDASGNPTNIESASYDSAGKIISKTYQRQTFVTLVRGKDNQ